jgi:hypothetical protein
MALKAILVVRARARQASSMFEVASAAA